MRCARISDRFIVLLLDLLFDTDPRCHLTISRWH
jgi:hypothetical protein